MEGTTVAILIVVLVIVLLLIGVVLGMQKKKREREGLRERFGPEYDRAVEEQGGERAADKRLADVAAARDKLEIRDLSRDERERYGQQWTGVQAAFVDDPAAATRDADRLVGAVMRDRGYPVDDFDTKAHMLSAEDPQVTEHYRAAHDVGVRTDDATTEELRQAFVHYRELFQMLLAEGSRGGPSATDTTTGTTTGTTDGGTADTTDLRSAERASTDGTPRT